MHPKLALFCVVLAHMVGKSYAVCEYGKHRKRYDGYKLIRVEVRDMNDLMSILEQYPEEIITITEARLNGTELIVSRKVWLNVSAHFESNAVPLTIIQDDVQRSLEESYNTTDCTMARKKRLAGLNGFALNEYHSYDQILGYLNHLESSFPDLVSVRRLGKTAEGRDLKIIKLGPRNERVKKAIWVDSGIHAREWIAPAAAIYTMTQILNGYNHNESRYLLEQLHWYFLLIANPDGYEFSHKKDRFWRKNRFHNIECGPHRCCNGVDLNRNFDFAWLPPDHAEESVVTRRPCSEAYKGVRASSELETIAISNFIARRNKSIRAVVTTHAYGQVWLYPYSYQNTTMGEPADIEDTKKLCDLIINRIEVEHGVSYPCGNTAEIMYPAYGTLMDWAKGVAGIKYVLAVELPPDKSTTDRQGFAPQTDEIVPIGKQLLTALKTIAIHIINESDADAT